MADDEQDDLAKGVEHLQAAAKEMIRAGPEPARRRGGPGGRSRRRSRTSSGTIEWRWPRRRPLGPVSAWTVQRTTRTTTARCSRSRVTELHSGGGRPAERGGDQRPSIGAPAAPSGGVVAVLTEAAIRDLAGITGGGGTDHVLLSRRGRTTADPPPGRRAGARHHAAEARQRANGHRSVHDDLAASRPTSSGGFDRQATRGPGLLRLLGEQPVGGHRAADAGALAARHQPRARGRPARVGGPGARAHRRPARRQAARPPLRVRAWPAGRPLASSSTSSRATSTAAASASGARRTRHVEELAHQHLRNAARAAFDLWQASGFHHLAIGAPDAIASELERALHPYLQARLCGRVKVAVGASAAEVLEAAEGVEADVERRREAEVVSAPPRGGDHRPTRRRRAGPHARGAVRPSRRAARRVEGLRRGGLALPRDRRAARSSVPPTRSTARVMERVPDVVEDAIEEALSQGLPVTICAGNADLDVLGRVGALLRY